MQPRMYVQLRMRTLTLNTSSHFVYYCVLNCFEFYRFICFAVNATLYCFVFSALTPNTIIVFIINSFNYFFISVIVINSFFMFSFSYSFSLLFVYFLHVLSALSFSLSYLLFQWFPTFSPSVASDQYMIISFHIQLLLVMNGLMVSVAIE